MQPDFTIGDSVLFDSRHLEQFVQETSATEDLRRYQQLVVAGIEQAGTVKDLRGNLTTVVYPDGWELPVPTRYLVRVQTT